jgi:hypothetical protein
VVTAEGDHTPERGTLGISRMACANCPAVSM